MRILSDLGIFAAGLLLALASTSVTRVFGGSWGVVQFPIIALALAVFFLSDERLIPLAIGIGLGLDVVSSYPFLTWTVIVGGTAFAGWWIAKNVLTNRALPSLILLGAAMRVTYFILEVSISRFSELAGGSVWYRVGLMNWRNVALAFAIEMIIMIVFFMIHVRIRGERTRMLTHVG